MTATVVKDSQLRLDPVISQDVKVQKAVPSIVFRDTDQTLPDGLWRVSGVGDDLAIQLNTGTDFSTSTTFVLMRKSTDSISGGIRFQNLLMFVGGSNTAMIRFVTTVGITAVQSFYRPTAIPKHLAFSDSAPTQHILQHYDDYVVREAPSGSINGSNVTFTLAGNVEGSDKEMVFLNGLLQNEGGSNDYTITDDTITFNTAPIAGDVILVTYLKQAV